MAKKKAKPAKKTAKRAKRATPSSLGAMRLSGKTESALQAKISGRALDEADEAKAAVASRAFALEGLIGGRSYDDTPQGSFEGLESIRLRWVRSDGRKDWFEFIPRTQNPFAFVRANGQRIEPRRMFTDGGSVPKVLWGVGGFSPWGNAPAFLVHDYQFDAHHCGVGSASFNSVRDTMMEAVKTLMVRGLTKRDKTAFQLISAGISSPVARDAWDRNYPTCPLPPDSSE